jgi:ribosomal subunit interface protein
MQIILKHKDLDITDAIKNYAISKFETLSNHIKQQNSILEIEISKNSNAHKHGNHYELSVKVIINKNKVFVKHTSEDIYNCIDILRDKVMENVTQSEDKKRTKERSLWRKIKDKLKSKDKYDDDAYVSDLGSE